MRARLFAEAVRWVSTLTAPPSQIRRLIQLNGQSVKTGTNIFLNRPDQGRLVKTNDRDDVRRKRTPLKRVPRLEGALARTFASFGDTLGRKLSPVHFSPLSVGVVIALLFPLGSALAGALEDCAKAYDRRDYAAAVQLCRPLAERGDARAQLSLGGMYYNGQGVQQDYAEASKWTRKAAEQGYTPAQADLGVLYWNGQGVQQDVVLAYMWLSLAARTSRMW